MTDLNHWAKVSEYKVHFVLTWWVFLSLPTSLKTNIQCMLVARFSDIWCVVIQYKEILPYVSNFNSRISGFRHEVEDNCAVLSYYAASSGNFLPTFRDNLSVPHTQKSAALNYFLLLTFD
jgi:hypothetical protein